jgi:hypothetical protein
MWIVMWILSSHLNQGNNAGGQKKNRKIGPDERSQMKVLRSVARSMMYDVETVVKRVTMLGVTANQKVPIGRSTPKGLGSRRQIL